MNEATRRLHRREPGRGFTGQQGVGFGTHPQMMNLGGAEHPPRWPVKPRPGLAPMQAARGSFIAYATAPGAVAVDGTGRNGTYTKHLFALYDHPRSHC